jgi:uncharacterized protein (UPF0333 family)
MISGEKGQITIEAILILGFFILIFFSVTVPMVFKSREAAIDTSVLADARFATEQIAGAANQIVVNGSKRTIEVYVPGYDTGSISIGTRICTDGSNLNTTVAIVHGTVSEEHKFSTKLYGGNWGLMNNVDGSLFIAEDSGKRYTIVLEYKSINSTTANSFAAVSDCTEDLTPLL